MHVVTDDERCEVAERLRAYGKEFGDATWRELCNVVLYDEDRYPSTVRKLRLIDRLADLIDPGESGQNLDTNRDTVQQESPAVQKAPECDREALLELARWAKSNAWYFALDHPEDELRDRLTEAAEYFSDVVNSIREACGEVDG